MTSRIAELARIISENVATVDDSLRTAGEPEPSFSEDAPKSLAVSGDSEVARKKAIAAATELTALLKGPGELLRPDWTEQSSLRIITRLGLAALVPRGVEASFADLATTLRLPERDVRRVLRHAMTRHIFREPRKGYVAHTALSRLLADDPQQIAVTSTVVDTLFPAVLTTAEALQAFPGSEEANETGFSIAHQPGQSMWETFAQREDMGRRFGMFIGRLGADQDLIEGIEWKGKVVDIGGSHGHVMIDVLRACPAVTSAVVQDLPDVVAAGQDVAPKDLGNRLVFQAHSFFDPQPQEADIFFLRWILHNWSDKYSVKIIRNLIPVMKSTTTIVIHDMVLPEPNTLPADAERLIRNMDMTMLGLLNATERDADEWHQLFEKADPRFHIKSIRKQPPGIMATIQVGWNP